MVPQPLGNEIGLGEVREYFARLPVAVTFPATGLQAIHAGLCETSQHVRQGDFNAISEDDLDWLFAAYDRQFFSGAMQRWFFQDPSVQLKFRLSRRMSRTGGTTTLRRFRSPKTGAASKWQYEIAIAVDLVYASFRTPHRTVKVNGISCTDRLQALQRIFEHELIHLLELRGWMQTACAKSRFQEMAARLFGHRDYRHELITSDETARVQFGLKVGDRVTFAWQGGQLTGLLNRVTKRATVLVPDTQGALYRDGKRYLKYYVPISALRRATA